MNGASIVGTGVWFPEPIITNEELCASFNEYVRRENERRADDIAAGRAEALKPSSPGFIENASGIKQRHVWNKTGVLDPARMAPDIPERSDEEMSVQCEMALHAARRALAAAGWAGEDLGMIILATSNLQRLYPGIGMELQAALGARGFAYDMTVACSSATFALQAARDAIRAGTADRVLVVNPELMTGHNAWTDRDCHFIFGDASTAVLLERSDRAPRGSWEIVSTRLMSRFSSNIRNNGGYLNRAAPDGMMARDKLFYQHGRKVFKDIVPMAHEFIAAHLADHDLAPARIARYWLHQANGNMNALIIKRLLGREATAAEAPLVLDRVANTASCGSIIAFDHHADDLPSGTVGLLCSFGAGYSIGSVILRRT
jgi:beta-ketodecanoyl-[acyl-carrier-protein] synthase